MADAFADEKYSPLQRMAIKALTAGYNEIVHAVLFAEADASLLKRRPMGETSVSLTACFIKLIAQALAAHPHVNAVFAEGMRRRYFAVNIGLAVSGEDGTLSVPVIRNVDKLSLAEIDAAQEALTQRARAKKLCQDDFGGAAVTLSNLGMFRSMRFGSPVIPLGQGAILVVGAIHNGHEPGEWRLPLSLGFDHRVMNGAPAAAFLQTFIDMVERDAGQFLA